jgi:glutamine synthetase
VDKDGNSVNGSNYQYANKIFEQKSVKEAEFWFGIEQEYFFINPYTNLPFDFRPYDTIHNKSLLQGKYYCGIGGNAIYGIQRKIVETHMQICLEMDIPISGTNAEVAPNQWEYQVGPCIGIKAAHDLWMSRYILKKIAEQYDMDVTFHPKPIRPPQFEEYWNGSGAHINISTKESRSENGLNAIYQYIKILRGRHQEHLQVYGEDNELRLTGNHETGSMNEFTFGVGTRNTSIRIPNSVAKDGKGYFEDRRPASNIDPYLACGIIAETLFL